MIRKLLAFVAVVAALAGFGCHDASARDGLVITVPRRSELTPVQRLNRAGVEATKKHQYDKAAALFYKAYLYDPADPFTLNNLGYISEVQGELDRARRFYALASEQGSDANIDRSNAKQLEGKPMKNALEGLQDIPMRVNRMNVDAMALLSDNRDFEAIALLKKAVICDPQNPFTRNNLAVAYEAVGDYDNAFTNYGAAADLHSSERVVVTTNHFWRGKPVSSMAAESAKELRDRVRKMDPAEANAVMFSVRGVSAANENDWRSAREDFVHAYSLNPESAFSLNNRGYVAEGEGDLETAQFFYEKALKAGDSNARVGLATQRSAEGKKLSAVANGSNQQVVGKLEKYSEDRHLQTGPIELMPRDSSPTSDFEQQPEMHPYLGLPTELSPSPISLYPR